MQYVLSDAEYAFIDDLKKTFRSWELIFERFKLKFKDCPLTTKGKLQRCYGYKTIKIKKEQGLASSPMKKDQGVASSPIESGDLVKESRKRKRTPTKKRDALPADASIDESTSTDGAPDDTIAYSRKMIDALIAESDALLVRLEAETAQRKHFETELTASQTAYTDLFEDTQATINRAVKDALDEYKTTELFKAMDQAETAAQVTSCDNP